MDDTQSLIKDIEDAANQHAIDMRRMRLLLRVAERNTSREGSGAFWLETCDGDLARCKAELGRLQTDMNEMLLHWYVGAVLAQREPKEMK